MEAVNFNIWFIAKLLFLFALGVYLVFASVVVRQVYLMIETLNVGFNFPIKSIVWLHLSFAVLVFVLALVTL